jgi:stage V sporulation protein D (sporulation-specific penicillin-binding protein)
MSWRHFLFLFSLFCSFLLFSLKLYTLQVKNGAFYKALAQGISFSENSILSFRGKIFFRNGEEMATNAFLPFVWINPKEIREKERVVKKLSLVLELPEDFIKEGIERDTHFFILKRRLSPFEVKSIQELSLEGVYIDKEYTRFYPNGKIASKVIGFVNQDGKGQYGLEEFFDERLKEGKDIITTLDIDLQKKAEAILEKAKEKLDIESGQIIVINPKNGEILALADFPNFDPNFYLNEKKLEIFQNSATQKFFEPGSTFKPITMAAAIQEGKVSPNTTFVDNGFVKIGGWVIRNFENRVWGEKTMTDVLSFSINTGAVFVQKKLGNELFFNYLEKFGFFEKTGVQLPENVSENSAFKKGYDINFATASFGQGIQINPLQLIRGISVIANGGKLVKLNIVFGEKPIEKEIISSQTARTLTEMLVKVVEEGYGKRAKVPGYFIAGKTGTSQIPYVNLGINKKGYSEETWQSFIGWIPAFDPQFLFLVKLDRPKAISAGYSTTGFAKELIEFLINYYQISPDYEPSL